MAHLIAAVIPVRRGTHARSMTLPMTQVMLDRVRAPTPRQPGLEVHFQAQLGADADAGHALAAWLRVRKAVW